jgi:hypothetical protein
MRKELAVDGKHCIRILIGRLSLRAILPVRRFVSAIRHCVAPLRSLAADLAYIPFAYRARPTARAVITISIQARGERRAPRFNC